MTNAALPPVNQDLLGLTRSHPDPQAAKIPSDVGHRIRLPQYISQLRIYFSMRIAERPNKVASLVPILFSILLASNAP